MLSPSIRTPIFSSRLFVALLILGITCTACNHIPRKSRNQQELTPYVSDFIKEGQKRQSNFMQQIEDIKIEFGDLPDNKGGSCKKQTRLVTINPDLWGLMDSVQRKVLVFHELAHCVLDRDHNDRTLSRGECMSIMIANASHLTCFYDFYSSDWREYYLDELFEVETEIPKWYHDDLVLTSTDLDSLLIDTTTLNHFRQKIPDEVLGQDYTIVIDSFNQQQLISMIQLRWTSYAISIDIEEGYLEVESRSEVHKAMRPRSVVPRVYLTKHIPQLIKTVSLRSKNGFYDIFLNNELAYRTSVDSIVRSKKEWVELHLYSAKLKVINSSFKMYSLKEENELD